MYIVWPLGLYSYNLIKMPIFMKTILWCQLAYESLQLQRQSCQNIIGPSSNTGSKVYKIFVCCQMGKFIVFTFVFAVRARATKCSQLVLSLIVHIICSCVQNRCYGELLLVVLHNYLIRSFNGVYVDGSLPTDSKDEKL